MTRTKRRSARATGAREANAIAGNLGRELRFRGSSAGWVRALVDGSAPPAEPGIVWADTRAGRITELRLRR